MNLILFTSEETQRPLPLTDARAQHIVDVLRRDIGDAFDVGLVNGPRGKATLLARDAATLTLSFVWGEAPPPPDPITLLLGLPRPQTARDILRDATTLGVTALHFVLSEKTEPNYAQSTLWRDDEWRRHVIAGAQQAFATQIPTVVCGEPLDRTLAALPQDAIRLALDNYEAGTPLAAQLPTSSHTPLVLALGPERGWGPRDRVALRAHGFMLAHLGTRVLRLETAVVSALALAKSARGAW